MTVGFSGDVAEYYARYRRGYPPEVIDVLQAAFALTGEDAVLDLGCGTGQLAVPVASRVGSVIGMDPEPDMLRFAREAAAGQGVRNVAWVLGADTDVPALAWLLGQRSLGMAVIGQALHWMRHDELFQALFPLCRRGGGIAVVANGAPLWLQDSAWSRALRSCLEDYFDTRLEATCGTGADDRRRYAQALEAAGFAEVRESVLEYGVELGLDEVVGSVCSAIPADRLPGPQERTAFAERIRRALPPPPYRESVRVATLLGRVT
ncbi:class I SAM-dependent methyltransferase [Streptomyces phytophilus]|uniref:class I SAM-dependent methyltransferase n=1 Tax=Streptomyces phytophilus TaxID=722715 RepID=UPI0015F08945|nr:class I SAM-dependent methyltransferase [Streptomyces phytophilus]